MKHISVLIKPASSECNLRCKYCFYANVSDLREVKSHGRMQEDVSEAMINNIFKDLVTGDRLTLAFQGGEPTLAGLTFFRKIVDFVNAQETKVNVEYAIQTNGTLINDRWCKFFKENNFLVGLSIDADEENHNSNRIDARQKGTFKRILRTKKMFDEYKIQYNVLCVLTEQLGQNADSVFEFIREQNIQYIQFIPCLDDLDAVEKSEHALTPKNFGLFYRKLFKLWMSELEKGHYISIKLFDDLMNLLVDKKITACGILGDCAVQYVIEADGSVYPCDFYVLDENRMGYIQDETLFELFSKDVSKRFICEKPPLPEKCQTCEFLNMCYGGCKRMRNVVYVDGSGKFCGYQSFLKLFVPQVPNILEHIRKIEMKQMAMN